MKKQLLFVLFSTLLLISCQNNEKQQELDNKNQILQTANREQKSTIDAQSQKINQLEERLSKLEENKQDLQDSQPNDFSNYSGQYYFIVLEIEEFHYPNTEKFFYTTKVNQLSNYDDNIKYQLLDEVVSNYKNSVNAKVYKGSVNNRNIYLFNTYEQASQAREKYIMN
ncbi:hypothetical protein ACK1KB_13880 [Chryseobacterium sp. TY3]